MSEAAPPPLAERTRSIDLLRGIVMMLMVLDHARDFFVGIGPGPTAMATTTVPLFLTRWVTHFCAPVFVLLAGVSAQLYATKHGLPRARKFLLTRGLWLVVLELTIVRFAWIPDPFYHFVLLQVIWVLGWAMVVLAGLSYLPRPVVVALGALIVLGHNLLDPLGPRHLRAARAGLELAARTRDAQARGPPRVRVVSGLALARRRGVGLRARRLVSKGGRRTAEAATAGRLRGDPRLRSAARRERVRRPAAVERAAAWRSIHGAVVSQLPKIPAVARLFC